MVSLADYVPHVYFPKYVGIENKGLWVLQLVAYLAVVMLVGGIVASNLFPSMGEPMIRLGTSIDSLNGIVGQDFSSLCTSDLKSMYDYSISEVSGWNMENTSCASWCSQASSDSSCIREADAYVNDAAHDMFVATSYTEELHLLMDSCPFSIDADGECKKKGSYIIPGAEQAKARIEVSYQIEIPDSVIHKYSTMQHITTLGLRTVVRASDGTVYKEFGSGEAILLTVQEALEAAGFDSAGLDARAPDARSAELPSSTAAGTSARPAARVTGLDIVMTVEIGNKVIKPFGDPTCVITVGALQTWSSHQVVSAVDADGSVRARTYSGVRFKFHTKGEFQWPQLFQISYAVCLAVAWMRIPFVLVFYFAVFMLGGLSDVYNGFLYQTLNFHKEFVGVCARMLKTSYAFTDLHDLEDEVEVEGDDGTPDAPFEVWGISRERIARRMETIFAGTEMGRDKAKLDLFVNFVFAPPENKDARTAAARPRATRADEPDGSRERDSKRMPESGIEAIKLEDFIKIFGSKEDLIWEDILTIFDTGRPQNTLEKLFMDSTLKRFYEQEMRIGHMENIIYKVEHQQMMEGLGWLIKEDTQYRTDYQNTRTHAKQALNLRRDLGQLVKQSNLTRAVYVQEFLEDRIRALIEAKDRVEQMRNAGGIVPGINGERAGDDCDADEDGEEFTKSI